MSFSELPAPFANIVEYINAYAANKKLQIERKCMGATERPEPTSRVSLGYIDSEWYMVITGAWKVIILKEGN